MRERNHIASKPPSAPNPKWLHATEAKRGPSLKSKPNDADKNDRTPSDKNSKDPNRQKKIFFFFLMKKKKKNFFLPRKKKKKKKKRQFFFAPDFAVVVAGCPVV